MAFERKTWIDRQAEFPARRKLNPTGTADVYDVSRDEGLILEEGDPFNAATMNALEGRIEAALNDTILPATCTYSSGVFTLTGLPTALPDIFTVRFKAPADFTEGDTLSINAMPYALFMPNQQPAPVGAFAQNAVVSLNVDLATGKAFLAGGGGGSGKWISHTVAGSGISGIMHSCKDFGLLSYGIQASSLTSGATAFTISDNPITGSFNVDHVNPYNDHNTNPGFGHSVTLGVSNGEWRVNRSSLVWSIKDGVSGGTFNDMKARFFGTRYLPPENWL